MSYLRLRDGHTVRFVADSSHTFSCCACGLSHRFHLANPEPQVIEITINEDRRATAGVRRGKEVRARLEALVMGWLRR